MSGPIIDALPAGIGLVGGPFLRTLLIADLVQSTRFIQRMGDRGARDLFTLLERSTREALVRHGGTEINKSDGFLALFERPAAGVRFALAYHRLLADLSRKAGLELEARVGIHLGEVFLRPNPAEHLEVGAPAVELDGLAKHVTARVQAVALPRQTLLTRAASDLARCAEDLAATERHRLEWLSHGRYQLEGVEDPVELFELGRAGEAPLRRPPDSQVAQRSASDDDDDEVRLGWRAATGQPLAFRPGWTLERKLGEGGVGEVWLARHDDTGDRRVFKFCYSARRLRSLRREIVIFRLLRDALGHRPDIASILGWDFDASPAFVEAPYAPLGSLAQWAERQGGLGPIPLEVRLELMAQVADALAAAHSVGVLHKDVKPPNVLIEEAPDGTVRAVLSDFGIGQLTDRRALERVRFTVLGATELVAGEGSSSSGTMLYMAPELLEGRTPTVQSDIHALGVMIYQVVVGDFARALTTSWRRDVEDEVLAEDLARIVDGAPERRPSSAAEVARMLRTLDERRRARQTQRREREATRRAQLSLERSRKRRRQMALGLVLLGAFSVAVTIQARLTALEARRAEREAMRANRQARIAQEVTDYLVGLFDQSDPRVSKGEERTVEAFFLEARRRVDGLGEDPEVQATLQLALARVFMGQGLYAEAEDLQQEAVATRAEVHGAMSPPAAKARLALAECLRHRGRLDEAGAELRRARAVFEAEGALGQLAEALRLEGHVEFDSDRMDEARRLYERAMALSREATDDPTELDGLVRELSLARLNTGDETGLSDLLALHERQRRTLGSNDHRTLLTLTDISYQYRELGRLDAAQKGYQRARDGYSQTLGADHPYVSAIDVNLASVLQEKGRYEETLPILREALEDFRRRWGPNNWRTGATESNLALSLMRLGRLPEALRLLLAARRHACGPLPESARICRKVKVRLRELYRRRAREGDEARAAALAQELVPKGGGGPESLGSAGRARARRGGPGG